MKTIRIQQGDFDAGAEKYLLQNSSVLVGAVVEFTGCVRDDSSAGGQLQAIYLEHYPQMTEKAITRIVEQAFIRWRLIAVTVIHRVGRLSVGDNIVYVGVASRHRHDALQCVDFIMDFLKNDVPIWKKEITGDNSEWVAQKQCDVDAKNTWRLSE